MNSAFASRRTAFTLIELLAGMAILSLMVLLLFQAVGQVLQIGQGIRSDAERTEKALVAFDFMRRDIEALTLPLDSASQDTLEFVLNPGSDKGIDPAMLVPHAFFFQAAVGSEVSRGEVAMVGYFIRQNASASPLTSRLCRIQVDSSNAAYVVESSPEWLDTTTVLDARAAAVAPEYRGMLSDAVIALWVRAIDRDGNYYYQWSSRTPPAGSPSGNRLPAALEVAIVVLDQRSMDRLIALPTTTTSTDPSQMDSDIDAFIDNLPDAAQQGARVFRTSIAIPASSPL